MRWEEGKRTGVTLALESIGGRDGSRLDSPDGRIFVRLDGAGFQTLPNTKASTAVKHYSSFKISGIKG